MNFRDIKLKCAYETDKDNLIYDFYIPVLSCAKRYDRISGFFSSTSLALSARGLAGLIENCGKMRLITCPILSKEDIEIIKDSVENREQVIIKSMISNITDITDDFKNDHVAALGWMLAKGYLEIKIAIVDHAMHENSIMHQKVGILYDELLNGISFSGSINETASGWLNNVEEFKVFKDWEDKKFFESDQQKFDEFWNNKREGTTVIDLPTAVYNKLIEIGTGFDADSIALKKYWTNGTKTLRVASQQKEELKLFSYQKDAVESWFKNNHKLLFEMATGTGKTRTAIGCMKRLLEEESKSPILFVIACPQATLSSQWKDDIESLDIPISNSIVCDANSNWKATLDIELSKLATNFYNSLVVYTTHKTASSQLFVNKIESSNAKIKKCIIGDEVHGLGSKEYRNGLLDVYEYRIGLSATPSRWFDDDGTQIIADYFGNQKFEFTIKDALSTINPVTGKTFLVKYYYTPFFVSLTDEEADSYIKLTKRIISMSSKAEKDDNKLQHLMFRRANICKSAENKYDILNVILDEISDVSNKSVSDTIIFVSPEQMSAVMGILQQRNIIAHRFTEAEGTKPLPQYGGKSEREYLINRFKSGDYQVLVAIKCLDEGIDIPSAKRAIVMASSTNPREYIQRIGRIIRQAPDKVEAELYDVIIEPNCSGFDDKAKDIELKIFEREMVRVLELSANAQNNVQITKNIYKVLEGIKYGYNRN